MSKNTDRVMGHGNEADGIEEYDNPLPDWWLGLFFLCIAWAAWYFVDWHVITPKSQAALYEAELVAAAEAWPELDKQAEVDMSPEALALGEETFTTTCASCHKADMTGGIGPNLVDDEWIHGGDFASITTTIENGVAAKGMPQWGPILGPKKISAVASYILSKAGSAPAAAAEAPADASGSAEAPAEGDTPSGDAVAEAAEVSGEAVFTANCVACHQADMTGGIGPNLVDDEWIHGGTLEDITRTINEGVPAKGMITWKGVLADAEIHAVAKYVYDKSHSE